MTEILAIFAVAVLFILMGVLYRHRSCPDKKPDGSCADTCSVHTIRCPIKKTSESSHAHC